MVNLPRVDPQDHGPRAAVDQALPIGLAKARLHDASLEARHDMVQGPGAVKSAPFSFAR